MSVRDAIFPIVLTVSFFSINYKTPVSAYSTPLLFDKTAIKMQVNPAANTSTNQPQQPSCPPDIRCPR